MTRRSLSVAVLITAVLVSGCGGGSSSGGSSGPPVLQSIAVTPNPFATGVGIARQMRATGTYSDGTMTDLTGSATWSTSQAAIATVSAGLVTGLTVGSATITAAVGTVSGNGTLNVTANAWSPAASMASARESHTATLLNDGRVLTAGGGLIAGDPSSVQILASAEIYDPRADAWASAGSMATPRSDHAAALLPDGKVLVAGGSDNSGTPLASAEIFDSGSASWSAAPGMANPRFLHTATVLADGRVLVAGGTNQSGLVLAAEIYDPVANAWSPAGALATGRLAHTATLLSDGRVLVAGGLDESGVPLDGAELYDPVANAWSFAGFLLAARAGHAAALLNNGTVLVAGGVVPGPSPTDSLLASAEVYDPRANTWSFSGSMASGRAAFTLTLLPDGQVLAAGSSGYDVPNFGPTLPLATTELYDPSTGMWSAGPAMSTPRWAYTATLLLNGALLVTGGDAGPSNSESSVASSELFW